MKIEFLSYSQFEQHIKDFFQNRYGAEMRISIQEIPKNNGVLLRGFTMIPKGAAVAPTIYLEEFYREHVKGVSLNRITDKIEKIYWEGCQTDTSVIDYFQQYDKVKDTLVLKLVSYERNAEFLEEVPHKKLLDLAMYVQSRMESKDFEHAVITIRHEHLRMWNVDMEEFFQQAFSNSLQKEPEQLLGMRELLSELQGDIEVDSKAEGKELSALTNTSRINGAVVMFYPGALSRCAKVLDDDLIILPSSIHEVLLLGAKDVYIPELLRMVQEVNDTQVAQEDILSYVVYRYDRNKNILENYVTRECIELVETNLQ